MGSMREHLSWDVLKPRTKWCWADGPSEVRLPGGSLGALAEALVGVDDAILTYDRRAYAFSWSDLAPRQEDEDAVRAIREYKLTYRYQNRAGIDAGDQEAPPGPFVELVKLSHEDQGADPSNVDRTCMRDAIWSLLDEAGRSLDMIR